MQRAWHDPTRLTQVIIEGYRSPLKADDWDRALWEFSRAPRTDSHSRGALADRLGELAAIPTLVITGDDDRVVPMSVSRTVAEKIPGSRYVELPACGHVPQEECPAAFFAAVQAFLRDSEVLVSAAPVETSEVVETTAEVH